MNPHLASVPIPPLSRDFPDHSGNPPVDFLKLAVDLSAFRSPLKLALQAAAATGATGVLVDLRYGLPESEFSASGRRHLQRYLEELGLRIAAASFPTRRAFDDRTDLEARVAATCRALTFARELGSDVLILGVGSLAGGPEGETRGLLVDVLNDLARHGNHIGAVPTIAASGSSAAAVLELVQQLDEGPVGVDFDPAALTGQGADAVDAFRLLLEYIRHVRVRDAIRESEGQYREVPVGRGEVAWDEMLAVLDEAEYSGWLTATRTEGEDRAGDVARTVAWVRAVAMG